MSATVHLETSGSLPSGAATLLMVREAVGRLAGGKAVLDEEQANEVAELMERFLPEAPLGWLVSVGAPAVAAELARTPAQAP